MGLVQHLDWNIMPSYWGARVRAAESVVISSVVVTDVRPKSRAMVSVQSERPSLRSEPVQGPASEALDKWGQEGPEK